MPKQIRIILGTRPEAIKLAPVILKLREDGFDTFVIHTGQHSDLADDILDYFDIQPDLRLNPNRTGTTEASLLQSLMEVIGPELSPVKAGLVMVQGDTSSALAGALAAHYQKIPVAHLEAGLRSHDTSQPFPEETNRKLITHLAQLHFAPTATAKSNLLYEGIQTTNVHLTGNSVTDALKFIVERSTGTTESVRKKYADGFDKLILLTSHRRENLGDPQNEIFKAVKEVSEHHPEVKIVFPVHPNPAIQKHMKQLDGLQNVSLIEPLSYFEFIPLMAASDLILTDSGGIQEEAPALGVPVLVLRNKTERPELIEAGAGKLVGTDAAKITAETVRYLESTKTGKPKEIFGDGKTASRISAIIRDFFSGQ